MFLVILFTQLIAIASIAFLILYKDLFDNLFNLVTGIIIVALIPNFLTSLSLEATYISNSESQILFGGTGFIVLYSLYILLKNYRC
jgi:hypothetical protein